MKFYEHPAYIGYACDENMINDKRQEDWEEQFNERGFDNTTLWSLDEMIVRFLTPRIKAFSEAYKDSVKDDSNFHLELQSMIDGFEFRLSPEFNEHNEEHMKKLDNSFLILAQNHSSLWI